MDISPTPSKCRLVIADDHAVVRAAIRRLLESAERIEVIAEAGDAEEAVTKISLLDPDVAVVDFLMPMLDGVEVIRRIATSGCRTRILALSASQDNNQVRHVLAAGASGYLPKTARAADLIDAIRVVADGRHYVHPSLVNKVVLSSARPRSAPGGTSQRETEVLWSVAMGFANKEIAAKLGVSVKTVETYKARATQKIGATSRADIMRFAMQQGWFGGGSGR